MKKNNTDDNPLVNIIASHIHDERREEVHNIIYKSHNIERSIRSQYKNKDIPYDELPEDIKDDLRIRAHKIIQAMVAYDKNLEKSFDLVINPV